jgi:hypothetical protein
MILIVSPEFPPQIFRISGRVPEFILTALFLSIAQADVEASFEGFGRRVEGFFPDRVSFGRPLFAFLDTYSRQGISCFRESGRDERLPVKRKNQ